MIGTRDVLQLLSERIHRIVHGEALSRILVVVVDNGLTSQLRHAHDAVGIIHTILLYSIHGRIHLTTTAVEIGCMHMDTQRLTAYILRMDSSRIRQPVVSMNDIEVLRACHHTCYHRVVVDLLVQVRRIAASELHATEVVDIHVVEIRIDILAQLIVVVGVHDIPHPTLNIVTVHIPPGNGHRIHGNDTCSMLLLITKRMRQTKCDLNVALRLQSFRDAIVGSGKTAKHMRRILPSKH